MNCIPIATTLYLLQSPRDEVRIFTGSSLKDYVQFLGQSGLFKSRVFVIQDPGFSPVSFARLTLSSNASAKLEPPFPSFLRVVDHGSASSMSATFLPFGYVVRSTINLSGGSQQDKADYIDKMKFDSGGDLAPAFYGSCYVGNGLKQLPFVLNVHPFFNDNRIVFKWTGSLPKGCQSMIAQCMGGKFVRSKTTENGDIVPDIEEIRKRAIETFAFRYSDQPSSIRNCTALVIKEYLRIATVEQMTKWIDLNKEDNQKLDKPRVAIQIYPSSISTPLTKRVEQFLKLAYQADSQEKSVLVTQNPSKVRVSINFSNNLVATLSIDVDGKPLKYYGLN